MGAHPTKTINELVHVSNVSLQLKIYDKKSLAMKFVVNTYSSATSEPEELIHFQKSR